MGFCLHLRAATLSVALLVAGTVSPAFANPKEQQEDSLAATFEQFAAALKQESAHALDIAGDLLEENRDSLAAAKARAAARLEAWAATLSEQKDRLARMAGEATADLDAWSDKAAASWNAFRRSTAALIESLQDWMRKHSLSPNDPETPV
jgi:hypothetical protein